MAAAFFAIEPLQEATIGARLVVWALHQVHARTASVEGVSFPGAPTGAPRFDPGIAIVRPSTRDNRFLAAQAGLFTSVSRSGIYFMRMAGKRPSLDEFVAESKPTSVVLRKIGLGHEHLADLIEILRRENISRSALMPTLDNVARDVRTKWAQQKLMA